MDLRDILPTGFIHTYTSIQDFLEDFGKREHKNKKWPGHLEKWAKDIDAGLEHVLWDFFLCFYVSMKQYSMREKVIHENTVCYTYTVVSFCMLCKQKH